MEEMDNYRDVIERLLADAPTGTSVSVLTVEVSDFRLAYLSPNIRLYWSRLTARCL
jgi:hypothetical protein